MPSCLHRLRQSLDRRRRDRGHRTALVDQSPLTSVAWSLVERWDRTTYTWWQSSQQSRYHSSLCRPIGTICIPACMPVPTNHSALFDLIHEHQQPITSLHTTNNQSQCFIWCYTGATAKYLANISAHHRQTNHSALFDLMQDQQPITSMHTTNNQSNFKPRRGAFNGFACSLEWDKASNDRKYCPHNDEPPPVEPQRQHNGNQPHTY